MKILASVKEPMRRKGKSPVLLHTETVVVKTLALVLVVSCGLILPLCGLRRLLSVRISCAVADHSLVMIQAGSLIV